MTVCDQRCLDECGMDPAKRGCLVGPIARACRKRSRRPRHDAGDCSMTPVKAACRSQRVIERAEDHREHELEGATETADGVGKDLGMLGYGGGFQMTAPNEL